MIFVHLARLRICPRDLILDTEGLIPCSGSYYLLSGGSYLIINTNENIYL